LTDRLTNLFTTAINSDDLRVRAAGIEVDIAARNLEKTPATVDRLENVARSGEQGPRANALWDLGLLGSRGIEPERVAEILLSAVDDANENVRYSAVEGLAFLGTDRQSSHSCKSCTTIRLRSFVSARPAG
jgi:HEAT repeat protein